MCVYKVTQFHMHYNCIHGQNSMLKLIEVKIVFFNLYIHIHSAHLRALFSLKLFMNYNSCCEILQTIFNM